jgi:hypothetical protein
MRLFTPLANGLRLYLSLLWRFRNVDMLTSELSADGL